LAKLAAMRERALLVQLVRHGETAYNAEGRFLGTTDVALSERGRAQAQAAAAFLAGRPVSAVHTSPLLRARQTAGPIALAHGLALEEHPELAELHHGELEGLPFAELPLRYPHLVEAWLSDCSTAQLPGGETIRELHARCWATFEKICEKASAELCVVSHKLALLTIVAGAIGLELCHTTRLELELGSVSTLELRPGRGWRLLALNATAHLPPP
jgi:broad specificity phosphatase PhoE